MMIGPTMPLLTIHHKTEYRYSQRAALGGHRIMPRPATMSSGIRHCERQRSNPESHALLWIASELTLLAMTDGSNA